MRNRFPFIQALLVAGLICTVTGISLAGTAQKQLVEESAVEQIIRRGTMRVGMSTFVPWAMKDKTGKWIGFEIDVASRLAKDMGVKIEFIPTKWAGIIPALLTGKFDVLIGGMTIRPDRNLKVNFTMPYDYSGQTICAQCKSGIKPYSYTAPEVFTIGSIRSTEINYSPKQVIV